jgi:hypothetical protein
MAQQPKNNIGNVMIITPKRERIKKTTHAFIRLDNSVSEEGNSVKKLLASYWGSATNAAYKTFAIADEVTKYCPSDAASGYGMMTFKVESDDILAKNVENISTEAFNEDNLTEKEGNTVYRFVLEGKYVWRQDGSEFSADGFGHIRDDAGAATHIVATFGQEARDGGTWYYLILRAANTKNGKINIIEDFTGGGGEPAGSGTPIPPTLP